MLNSRRRFDGGQRLANDATAWTVVVPVKGTADAKSRLDASPELATAIALDTVSAALAVTRVIVVTSPQAMPMFSKLGAEVMLDLGGGLNQAIEEGVAAAGDSPVAVLLGDLPSLAGPELAAALNQAGSYPRAMVPDADGVGTVLITAQRGSTHEPAFGGQSRQAHLDAGYVELSIPPSSGLRRDVDTAEQLNQLAASLRLGERTAAASANPRSTSLPPLAHTKVVMNETMNPSRRLISDAVSRAEVTGMTDVSDAEILFSARGDELERLLVLASGLRDEGLAHSGRPGVITYSKKVFVPITKLCRDRCHYCVFVETPSKLAAKGEPMFMSPEEILNVARTGAELGCKEALFTLGDRPEDRWPAAREWLARHGYASTLEYIRAMAIRVLEETGLLPHLNPGVLSWAELQRLRPVAPSMGMMLETTSVRLWAEKGRAHYGSPDKDPALRLRVLDDAGRSRIPFTTGVLLGIGENNADRAESLFAIRAVHERHGHIQETIVQNFRAKQQTAMQNESDLGLLEYVAAVAVTRLVMGPEASVQAPPNLTDKTELALLVRAGIDDWGGVSPLTADHVNPERPWPYIDDLARLTLEAGYELRERLTVHPQYIADEGTWIDERIQPHVKALAHPSSSLAIEQAPALGKPWSKAAQRPSAPPLKGDIASILLRASRNPSGLADSEYIRLLETDQIELDALCVFADEVRHDAVGNDITYVVNRNIDAALFNPHHAGPAGTSGPTLSLPMLRSLVDEARTLGASEVCVQGGMPAEVLATGYFELVGAIRAQQPDLHIHAYRPAEILDGASRLGISVQEFLQALKERGLDSIPGTGARILDDRIRGELSGQTDPPVSDWVEVIKTAHSVGLKSTATMVFGHIESPAEQVAHLRTLISIQDTSGGFTEFIPMPILPADVPASLAGVSRPGPDLREIRAVHAVARLMLNGRLDNVQTAWTKLGLATSQTVLRGGANDFGGLLLDGTVWPEAGPEANRTLSVADVEQIAAEMGRTIRQRTTDYGSVLPLAGAAQARS
ncbi:7,8-didemethyl-8-hydroxy-5-deazariboflavin synthase CofG [Arthrobacter wenxiniae]|uniref:7,8-didemethyl-8-hydroxy-5-deazariboflavin synthase n=1 Tax=Arthrobacter wenxiniae TaxID=2713570 RepID=A0A7Y7IF32_9MICC|nr:7,8-didemethyl-8-hydroxy-5-deazariboflavin synthase CofG [Arthrobacter wenxiniae]NVM94319.1 7,8-didemethyl-8-hydroxy-5-deazariboflavin synthase CofG [Arthrobacter wenxiniae]